MDFFRNMNDATDEIRNNNEFSFNVRRFKFLKCEAYLDAKSQEVLEEMGKNKKRCSDRTVAVRPKFESYVIAVTCLLGRRQFRTTNIHVMLYIVTAITRNI
jgi:hypothetical protein